MPRFAVQDLLWLVVVVGIICAWWMHSSRLRTKLHWASARADTNDATVAAVCKAFEREESYICDVFFVRTPHGNFYTGMNVIRPTDSSFWVDLPGDRFSHLSVDLRDDQKRDELAVPDEFSN